MKRIFSIINEKISDANPGNQSILSYINPTDEEKKELVTKYLIDEHTLACALDPDEPGRVEQEPNHIALIFKRPKNYSANDRFLFKVVSIGLFIFKDQLIIVQAEDIELFKGKQFYCVKSTEEASLKVILACIHHYLGHLKGINQITEEIEDLISVSMENKHLLNLFSLEKSLVYYLSAINSNNYALEKFKALAIKNVWNSSLLELLDDLIVENTQCYRQAEIHSNILASLMDARVSIVSNNLNILMKTLNLITIFIMVPTLVVSVFSMNVSIPLEKHPWAFWLIMGLTICSIIIARFAWIRFSTNITRINGKR
jgi:magnesium transporter